jgi:acyl-phosphate glycerol 3-phosphate acyltransferase
MSPEELLIAAALYVAYLIGGIPFGYLIARMKGVDLFEVGSGNIGATNVGRVLGRKWGVLVFLLDFAKGAVPVLVFPRLVMAEFPHTTWDRPDALAVAVALWAFLGHLFPIYLSLRGGKGVATGCGTVFVLVPGAATVAVLVWLAAVAASRRVSLGSVTAAVALVVARLFSVPQPFEGEVAYKTWYCIAAAGLVIVRHVGNLRRLVAGRENQLRDTSMWPTLNRALHVLALGTWCGAALFFNFLAAPAIFESFKEVVKTAPSDRTAHLPLAPSATEEQKSQLGSALAGAAVGPLFPRFFAMEAVCGAVALITALRWWREPGRVQRWRVLIIALALALVVVSWPISEKVSALRIERFTSETAREAFGLWHSVSLLLSLVTAVMAFVSLALAARMPAEQGRQAIADDPDTRARIVA